MRPVQPTLLLRIDQGEVAALASRRDDCGRFIGCEDVSRLTLPQPCEMASSSHQPASAPSRRRQLLNRFHSQVFLSMELTSGFASRNACFDDWEVPLQRICDNQERLFDDMGPFDVRLIRMGTSNTDETRGAILRPKDLLELREHLLKTSCNDYRILYVSEL
jgi:hypothetical protein